MNIDLRVKIELEHQLNNDMVQVINLPEQYEYVTDREAALYTFVSHRCSQVKYLFKMDDDVFINTFLLLSSIPTFDVSFNRSQYLLMGYPIDHGRVVRHATDTVSQRYIITEEEYSCPRYPRFLSGFGYVLSFQTCSLFAHAYQLDASPFPLSDVYFTGLLPEMMNIARIPLTDQVNYLYSHPCNEPFFLSATQPFACAASADHFDAQQSKADGSFINDYNAYWTIVKRRFQFEQH